MLTNSIESHFTNDLGLFYSYSSFDDLAKLLDFFQRDKYIQNVFIRGKDVDLLYSEFTRIFKTINAAGGLVRNSKGEYLIIHRRGRWDLPKGKPESNESTEQTALREVQEETGITKIDLLKHITDTYHTYQLSGQIVIKKTSWFDMLYEGNEELKPQTIEDIIEAKWVPVNKIKEYLSNSYDTIREVFDASGIL